MLQEARNHTGKRAPKERLGDLDDTLEIQDYPTTMEQPVRNYDDYKVETQGGSKPIREALASVGNEIYDSTDDVRDRIQRLMNQR